MAGMFVDPHLFMYDPAKYILVSKEEVREARDSRWECPYFLTYEAEECSEDAKDCAFCALCKELTEFAEEDDET